MSRIEEQIQEIRVFSLVLIKSDEVLGGRKASPFYDNVVALVIDSCPGAGCWMVRSLAGGVRGYSENELEFVRQIDRRDLNLSKRNFLKDETLLSCHRDIVNALGRIIAERDRVSAEMVKHPLRADPHAWSLADDDDD